MGVTRTPFLAVAGKELSEGRAVREEGQLLAGPGMPLEAWGWPRGLPPTVYLPAGDLLPQTAGWQPTCAIGRALDGPPDLFPQ